MSTYVSLQLRLFHRSPLVELGIDADGVRTLMRCLQSDARRMSFGHFFLSDDDAYSTAMVGLGALLESKGRLEAKKHDDCGVRVPFILGSFEYPHNRFLYIEPKNVVPAVRLLWGYFFRHYQKWLYEEGGLGGGGVEIDLAPSNGDGASPVMEPPANDPTPDEILEIDQANRAYEECLTQLPEERMRQIIRLMCSGLSQTEISKILRLSNGTISTLLKRARASIKACLSKKGISHTDLALALPYST